MHSRPEGPKVFVLGNVQGQIESAFKKLAALQAKNNFSCAIVTGNLFAADGTGDVDAEKQLAKLLAGDIPIPVSTYFTVGTRPLPASVVAKLESEAENDGQPGSDICENLHFLGKRSVTKTADGVRIVALGGVLDKTSGGDGNDKNDKKDPLGLLPFHSVDDEKSLRGAHAADILLTAVWPHDIWRSSSVPLPSTASSVPATFSTLPSSSLFSDVATSDGLADLVVALRPRYVLTASPDSQPDLFYEREGFFHPEKQDGPGGIDITRFLSLATFGNAGKAKAMYAFALSSETPTLKPLGCTPSPYLNRGRRTKRDRDQREDGGADAAGSFSLFGSHGDDHYHGGRGSKRMRHQRQPPAPPPGPDKCYFCLSNPNLPTHMVCSIGNDAYLATAKGPLPLATTFAEQHLDFPGHMLIVPLSHAPTLAGADADKEGGSASAPSTLSEMTRFRESLQAMVAARSGQRLGTVTWEISRARNVHVHWQVVPVAAELVRRGLVEAAFRVEAENLMLPELVEADGDEMEGDYFRVWIWAEEADTDASEKASGSTPVPVPVAVAATDEPSEGRIIGKTLVMRFDDRSRFDLQYARKVLAKLMGLEARTFWQDSAQTVDEETADVAAFRKAFAEWDFTLRE